MSDHALHSPSGAERWFACPGSIALTRGLPDTDSEYSREGTMLHDRAAEVLLGNATVDTITGDDEFEMTPERRQVVRSYIDYINTLRLTDEFELLVEARVVAIAGVVYGTADAQLRNARWLHIADLKCGAGKFVEAEDNLQAKIYALGALLQHPDPLGVEGVTTHIVQPRRDNYGSTTYTVQELMIFLSELRRRVADTEAPNAPLVSGGHCTFCKREATCPRLTEDRTLAVSTVFREANITNGPLPPTPSALTNDEISVVLQSSKLLERWIASVAEEAESRLKSGGNIPGYKLVEKLSNRRWADEDHAIAQLKAMGIDPYVKKPVSPAQAEKLVPRSVKKQVDALTERAVTGVSVVPLTDKRTALPSPFHPVKE